MSASSVLPGLDMIPANLWVDAALAMVKVELYRNFGEKPFTAKDAKKFQSRLFRRAIILRIGHTRETRDSLRRPILVNRSHRSACIPGPAMSAELFQPRLVAPPDRAR